MAEFVLAGAGSLSIKEKRMGRKGQGWRYTKLLKQIRRKILSVLNEQLEENWKQINILLYFYL